MNGCRWYRGGECLVVRYGDRPSPAVCRFCESRGTNRLLGLGDVLRLAFRRPARVLGVKSCRCAGRQAALNRYVPLRSPARG